jgi:hypothetical protein
LSKSSPFEVKMLVEFIRRGISVYTKTMPEQSGWQFEWYFDLSLKGYG